MRTSLRTIFLAVLFVAAVTIIVKAPVHAGSQGGENECYHMMVDYCTRQANNAAEGGFDAAYDACVSAWMASGNCPTPPATGASRQKMPKAPTKPKGGTGKANR